MQQPRIITRRDLYDLVWSKPMSTLAIEFGMSDRGRAKVCGRHRIPVPPRGYWAKVAAGERPKVPPFLEWKDRSLDQVIVRGAISSLPDSIAELAMKRKAERQGRVPSEKAASDVPLSMVAIPHPTVAKTAKALRTKKPDSDGVVSATGQGHCGVIVSSTCTERAVVILDGLARGLEGSGLTLIPEGDKMSLKRGTDALSFTLLERTKRVKYIPSPEELAREERRKEKQARSRRRNDWDSSPFGYSPPWPEYVTEWTGELVFAMDVWADGLRKTWGDGKIQRIERLVPDIVAGIELVLEFIRVRREEREDRERKWQELQRRRKLAQARKEREEKRLAHLRHIIDLRREARDIRDWLASLPPETNPTEESDLGRMITWVGRRLADIDRQTGIEAAQSFAGTNDLFPQADELHDPEGDPLPGSVWGH